MGALADKLLAPDSRPALIQDCCTLIDQEVSAKKGLKGIAIKGAYGTVKAIRRGFVPGVVDALLDEFVAELEPYHEAFLASGGGDLPSYLQQREEEVAESLLSVTDGRADKSTHKTAVKLYRKLRSGAKANVIGALPGLGRVVEAHS